MLQTPVDNRQIIAARALLGLRQVDVAENVPCSHTIISMIERGRNLAGKARVVALLESRGIEFIRGGVRMRKVP